MKPTKEQLADPKWWDDSSNGYDYIFYLKRNDEYLFADDNGEGSNFKLIIGQDAWKLLAKRPEPKALDTDWLKKGVNVTTPKGIAEVRRITEDDGVYTSLGNFCRSELSEVKPEWVPEVGVDCEVKIGRTWMKCKVDYICEQYIVVLTKDSNGYGALVRGHYEFRQVKTQREELIDIINKHDGGTSGLLAKHILARFDLTEKDGE